VPRIPVDGIELNVSVEGEGEPVLLIHGFPDSSALWRSVTPRLNAAGYQTVALDQRGFGESDAPEGKRRYALTHLAADALAVLDALGIHRAHLVGHDWGAAVGWYLAGTHPDRFHTFTALSLGHARAYAAAGLPQLKKAWYILIVLIPVIGEWLVRARNWALLRIGTAHHPECERCMGDIRGSRSSVGSGLVKGRRWHPGRRAFSGQRRRALTSSLSRSTRPAASFHPQRATGTTRSVGTSFTGRASR
jgi:pimeloyl-ACP methyl ester carboxylesterase